MHGIEKRIVYIIRSDVDPSRHYVGITNDLRARLEWHTHCQTPANQWNPESELMPPVPLPMPAIESTTLIDFTNFRFL